MSHPVVIAALYKFVPLENYRRMKRPLDEFCVARNVKGTLLLAQEGINGTIAGSRTGIDAVLAFLRRDARLADLEVKESHADTNPFLRMKVRLKTEIVTMGVDTVDPLATVGTYVEPEDWNTLIQRDDVILVDTRNTYETHIGTFKGAIDPHTESFRDFPAYVDKTLDPARHKNVAMYCTGGIRCEKATSYLKAKGFENVYHLKGGILKYMERIPQDESLWQGECFVFDNRVAVNHALEAGSYAMCFACRMPLSDADMASPHYVEGVSCPHCHDVLSASEKARRAERQKQVDLAEQRGQIHIGAAPGTPVSGDF